TNIDARTMLQTSLYELLTFFFYGPLLFALIIAIFVGCLTGIYQWLKSEKTPLPYGSVNISRSSAVDAWSAIYTQAANANLEITKSFITVSGAVLVAATASIAIWPGAHAPITAVIVALIGLFSTVFPLASLRDESQKRLSMAASFLKEQPTGEILPYFLPSTVPY